jgi:aspartate-semialdehyde dehydrogenase
MNTMGSPKRIPVAVLGATGAVGQRFVALLADHPWFEVAALTASDRSAGRPYAEAVRWVQASPLPAVAGRLTVAPSEPASAPGCPLVFSALDAAAAGPVERAFADAGCLVVSNARNHRMEPDVPLVVPEVNGDHLALLERQRRSRPGGGAIATNPNCSTIGLVLAVKPLLDAFGVHTVHVVTMQAVSGAGLPGVASLEILDNLIPLIAGEEEKIETESRKIFGSLEGDGIVPRALKVGAQCNRVPVLDGHTLCISVGLDRRAALEEVRAAFEGFTAEPQALHLPSAPSRPVHYLERPDAPQPRLHRDIDGGMATLVGRLRACPVLDYRFVALSHNTLRGAAGGSILVGEQIVARGLLPGHVPPAGVRQ